MAGWWRQFLAIRVAFLPLESELKFTSPVTTKQNSNTNCLAFCTTLSLRIPEYSQWDDLDPYCATNIYVGVGQKLFVLGNKARN